MQKVGLGLWFEPELRLLCSSCSVHVLAVFPLGYLVSYMKVGGLAMLNLPWV